MGVVLSAGIVLLYPSKPQYDVQHAIVHKNVGLYGVDEPTSIARLQKSGPHALSDLLFQDGLKDGYEDDTSLDSPSSPEYADEEELREKEAASLPFFKAPPASSKKSARRKKGEAAAPDVAALEASRRIIREQQRLIEELLEQLQAGGGAGGGAGGDGGKPSDGGRGTGGPPARGNPHGPDVETRRGAVKSSHVLQGRGKKPLVAGASKKVATRLTNITIATPTTVSSSQPAGARALAVDASPSWKTAELPETPGSWWALWWSKVKSARTAAHSPSQTLVPHPWSPNRGALTTRGFTRPSGDAADGRLFSWGKGLGFRVGRVGTDEEHSRLGRVTDAGLDRTQVVAVAASAFSMALDVDGRVWTFGRNEFGELGRATWSDREGLPARVQGVLADRRVVSLAGGKHHAVVATEGGEVITWGANQFGQCGRLSSPRWNDQGVEVFIEPDPGTLADPGPLRGKRVVVVGAGRFFSLAVTDAGELYAWGRAAFRDQGLTLAQMATPRALYVGSGTRRRHVVAVDAGFSHAVILTADGAVYTFLSGDDGTGRDDFGRTEEENSIITGHDSDPWEPARVLGLDDVFVVAVAAGRYHSLAVSDAGEVFTWGHATNGVLGRGVSADTAISQVRLVAREGYPRTRAVGVAAGEYYSMAWTDDGTLWAWGDNSYAQHASGIPPMDPPAHISFSPRMVDGTGGLMPAHVPKGGGRKVVLGHTGVLLVAAGYQYGLLVAVNSTERTEPIHLAESAPLVRASSSRTKPSLRQAGRLAATGDDDDDDDDSAAPAQATAPKKEVAKGHGVELGAAPASQSVTRLPRPTTPVLSSAQRHPWGPGGSSSAKAQLVRSAAPDVFRDMPWDAGFDAAFKNPCWVNATGAHCLPYFHVLGEGKCGTRDLYSRLLRHPDIGATWEGEPRWWDSTAARDFGRYVVNFGADSERLYTGPDRVVFGDASSGTFSYNGVGFRGVPAGPGRPSLAQVMAAVQPNLRLIIMLRNPMERLYSSFYYYNNYTLSPTIGPDEFHSAVTDAIADVQRCLASSSSTAAASTNSGRKAKGGEDAAETSSPNGPDCVTQLYPTAAQQLVKGIYVQPLKRWLAAFPRDQILLLEHKDYVMHTRRALKRVFEFLGIATELRQAQWDAVLDDAQPAFSPTLRKGSISSAAPMYLDTQAALEAFYKPWNKMLADITADPQFLWGADSAPVTRQSLISLA